VKWLVLAYAGHPFCEKRCAICAVVSREVGLDTCRCRGGSRDYPEVSESPMSAYSTPPRMGARSWRYRIAGQPFRTSHGPMSTGVRHRNPRCHTDHADAARRFAVTDRKDDMDQHGHSLFTGTDSRPGHSGTPGRSRGLRRRAVMIAATFAAGAGLLSGASSAQAIIDDGGSSNFQASTATTAVSTAALSTTWPTAKGSVKVTSTTAVKTSFDGGMKRYYGIGDGSQNERVNTRPGPAAERTARTACSARPT